MGFYNERLTTLGLAREHLVMLLGTFDKLRAIGLVAGPANRKVSSLSPLDPGLRQDDSPANVVMLVKTSIQEGMDSCSPDPGPWLIPLLRETRAGSAWTTSIRGYNYGIEH